MHGDRSLLRTAELMDVSMQILAKSYALKWDQKIQSR